MKRILLLIWICCPVLVNAQKSLSQSFDASIVQKITFNFKYPELIKIKVWDKKEVLIKGTVKINNGQNDEAFELKGSVVNNELVINSEIKNFENLPKKITVYRDGDKYFFNTDNFNDPEVKKFVNGEYGYTSCGVLREITLEVWVPKSTALTVDAEFALVEADNTEGPVEIKAKHGGIDMNISADSKRDVQVKTKFGEIYTDLDSDFDQSGSDRLDYSKWTVITTKLNGGGEKFNLESKFGNIYIRRK